MNDKVIAENEFMKSNKYIWRPSKAFVLFLILTFHMFRDGGSHLIQKVKFNVL